MSWFTTTITSTLGRKILMALTGLFLIAFLIVHLSGNLQLLADDGGKSFNVYAKFMTTNPFIKFTSYGLYATFIIHMIWALMLTLYNKKSRPIGYANINKSATWSSRNMGILGTIILIFLVIHLKNFWYEMHWGGIKMVNYDGADYKNLFAVVDMAFSQLWYVILYVASMIGLAFHLHHGFSSAFQTLGLNHPKYNPVIKGIGTLIAVVIPVGYAAIPIIMFIKNS